MNTFLTSLIRLGKVLVLFILAYFFVGIFFVQNTTQLIIGFFVAIFITLPTIYVFYFKEKLPKLTKIWKIYRIFYVIFIVLYILGFAVGVWHVNEVKKSQNTIDFINSKKITLDDVMGKNLPPVPGQKLNDSTIAGIDANNNYIRDDVELAIFQKYPNSAKIRAAELQYAQALQLELTQVDSSETLVAVMKKKDSAYFCIGGSQKLSLNDLNKAEEEIVAIALNTNEREKRHADVFNKYMTGYSSPTGDDCDINISN